MKRFIKTIGFLLLFWMVCFVASAQQKHFIYVQSEDKQPFAIVLNGKVYSSSDYGYIIIPKLADGEYNFRVSFPMNKFPEQAFTCSINKKDIGYFLKNSNDAWALENMQTQKLIVSGAAKGPEANAFSDMLSEVVSDSNLTKTNTASAPVPDAANNAINPGENAALAGATVAAAAAPAFITDSIVQLEKISEATLDTGTSMLFVDKSQPGNDTINVFIPAEAAAATATTTMTEQPPNESSEVNNTVSENATQNSNPVTEAQDSTPVDITATNKDEAVETAAEKSTGDVSNPFYNPEKNNNSAAAVVASPVIASPNDATSSTSTSTTTAGTRYDCVHMLSDDDMDKLKRKMFSQDDDNKMVQYAVKAVGKKCITTDQVRTLGSLFSSDDGRYSLYDALYKFVYDYGNYPGLESQILDPYYKKRFAAMLR